MAELLTSIQTGSGTPVFESVSSQELQQRIDAFTSDSRSIVDDMGANSLFAFSSDVMVVDSTEDPSVIGADPSLNITSYDYYQKGTYSAIEAKLRYNYNMTTASVDAAFTDILSNITEELRPPRTSTTFTYDFKFSQNQNRTIAPTGSVQNYNNSTGGGY